MSSLSKCLKKMGLSEHEGAILRGAAKKYMDADGIAAQEAAIQAVQEYVEMLQEERASIVSQIEKQTGAPEAAPRASEAAAAKNKGEAKPIQDVGENLWYNRRNFTGKALEWDDVENLNETLKVREVVKAKVWPKPNYEQLVADGLQPFFARFVKQVYDGISTAPEGKSDEALQRYIAVVGRIREAVFDWAKDNNSNREFLSALITRAKPMYQGGPVVATGMAGEERAPDITGVILDRVWPETKGERRRFANEEVRSDARVIGGNRAVKALQFTLDDALKAMKEIEKGWPKAQEAWQKQGYRILAPNTYKIVGRPITQYVDNKAVETGRMYWMITPDEGRGHWSLTTPNDQPTQIDPSTHYLLVNDKGRIKPTEFATEIEAIEAAREATRRDGKGGDLRGMNIAEAERSGPERREQGENITPNRLMSEYGFRGVNFGREGWINQAERQEYLNHAYDALADMAELLDIPPKALSLNGMLGIAFGAQGRGGHSAAHFVPGVNEINLTKTKGAGTLAHEWGHALDHYFATQAGLAKSADPFLSAHVMSVDAEGYTKHLGKKVKAFGEEIRPEIVAQFKAIYEAMRRRPMTATETEKRDENSRAEAKAGLERWIKHIRNGLERSAENKDQALAEFDKLAERLRIGDEGNGYVKAGQQSLHEVTGRIKMLVRGASKRSDVDIPSNWTGLDSAAHHWAYKLGQKEAAREHIPQTTSTTYARESAAKDKEKGGKAYWATEWEMFARAFETFVADQLQAKARTNTFLSDAAIRAEMRDREGKGYAMPYPRGEDRAAIDAAIENLVDAIETRETERGVALFSREDQNGEPQPATGKLRYDAQARDELGLLEHVLGKGQDLPAGTFRAVRLPDDPLVQAVARAFGKFVVGVRVTEKAETPPNVAHWQGVTLPGLSRAIFLREGAPRPHLAILGHELAHQLRADNPALYREFVEAVSAYIRTDEYAKGFAERWGITNDELLKEEFIGEVLSDGFMSERFWDALGKRDPGLLGQVIRFVRAMMEKVARSVGYIAKTEQYLTDFDRVMEIAGDVMARYQGRKAADAATGGEAKFHARVEAKFSRPDQAESTPLFSRAPWYYSELANKVGALSLQAAKPDQWKATIKGLTQKGVKQAEIEATGVNEWLDLQEGKVTKQQIEDFLAQNGVRVEEVMLGGAAAYDDAAQSEFGRAFNELSPSEQEYIVAGVEGAAREDEGVDNPRTPHDTRFNRPDLILPGGENYRELLLTLPERDKITLEAVSSPRGWGDTEGGNIGFVERGNTGADFRSSHFDQPNILAHIRFNERTDADGKKVLFIEEIQSDWAQKGKRQGFASGEQSDTDRAIKAAAQRLDNATNAMREDGLTWGGDRTAWAVYDSRGRRAVPLHTVKGQDGKWRAVPFIARPGFPDSERPGFDSAEEAWSDAYKQDADRIVEMTQRQYVSWLEFQDAHRTTNRAEVMRSNTGDLVPQAPFVTKTEAWVALALKRMIRYAVDNGFDRIAWTTGAQQVDRYTGALRKAVDSIEWTKTDKGIQIVGYKNTGSKTTDAAASRSAGAAILANDMLGFNTLQEARTALLENSANWRTRWGDIEPVYADAIQHWLDTEKQPRTKVVDTTEAETALSDAIGKAMADRIIKDPNQTGTIEGENITVSDTGMAGFYDRIVPNVANDVLKKLGGGRVEEVALSNITLNKDQRQARNFMADHPEMYGEERSSEYRKELARTFQQPGFDITPALREAVANGLPLFSRGKGAAMTVSQVNNAIAEPLKKLKNVTVKVVQSADAIPGLTDAQRQFADIEGAYDDGIIYLVADNLKSAARALRVLIHEAVGHYGIEGMLNEVDPALFPRLLKQIRLLEKGGNRFIKELGQIVDERQPGLNANDRAAEIIALIAERGEHERSAAVRSLWQQIVDAVKAFGKLVFGTELTEQDVRDLVAQANRWVAGEDRVTVDRDGRPQSMLLSRAKEGADSRAAYDKARADGRTKLTYGQWQQVRTPEFKAWFGDWENNPDTASKAVDPETGEPLVVYHGTPRGGFGEFRTPSHFGTQEQAEQKAHGWMVFDGGENGQTTYPVYLSIQKMKRIQDTGIEADFRKAIALAKRQGYDGAVYSNIAEGRHNADSYIAFRPEQIKSAIGNRGTFDSSNPDIRFSRMAQAIASPKVSGFVDALMSSGRNLGLLNPINTQYHKAQMLDRQGKPGFKAVFDELNAYESDISEFATRAESQAQGIFRELKGILPKTWREYFRGAASEADLKAIAPWLHHGTLYGGGSPQEGVVWTDDELRGKQGRRSLPRGVAPLSTRQIALYRQALAAIGQSLEDNVKAITYRHVKKYEIAFDRNMNMAHVMAAVQKQIGEKLADLNLKLEQATEAADASHADMEEARAAYDGDRKNRELRVAYDNANTQADRDQKAVDRIEAEQERLKALRGTLKDLEARAQGLIDHGYMPLSRFGSDTVTARDADEKVVYFGTFDGTPLVPRSGRAQANAVADALREEHPEWTVTQGVKAEKAWKLYEGLSIDALENFIDLLDPETRAEIDRDAVLQEYLKNGVNNRSVMKRLIHRQGMPGFSQDVARTLAAFVTSNARNSAGLYHIAEAKRLVEDIPQEQGDVKDEAADLVEYVTKPGEEAAKLRSFLFFHFLGGSIAAATINLTQTPMVTAPWLNQYAGVKDVIKAITGASKLAVQDPETIGGDLGKALMKAEQDGVTAPQQIYHLTATAANNPFSSNRQFRTFMTLWGGLFGTAEVFNRRVAFISAYNLAEQHGLGNPETFARRAVTDTQFLYSKANRPNLARGAVGGTIFTFKTFSISYLELMRRLPPKQQLMMLGMLMLVAGAEGLPFAEDLEDLIDTLGQWLGFSTNTGKWVGKVAKDVVGEDLARPILKGLGGVLPIDLHSRMSMQNLLPATAFFKPSEIDKTRDVAEAVGPLGGVVSSLIDSLQLLARGKWDRAAIGASPKAMRDAYNGLYMALTGESEDAKGRLALRDVTGVESVGKAIGFNPQRAAAESEIKRETMLDRNLRLVRYDEIASDWADAILKKDPEKQREALETLRRWNENNPEMRINPTDLRRAVFRRVQEAKKTSAERFIKSLPRTMRPEAASSLQ